MLKSGNFVTTPDTKSKGGRPSGSTAVRLTMGRIDEIARILVAYESPGQRLTPLVKALARKWEVSERVMWYYVKAMREGKLVVTLRSSAEVKAEIEAKQKNRKALAEFESYIANSTLQRLRPKALYEKTPSQLGDAIAKRVIDRMMQEIEIGNELSKARPSGIRLLQERVDLLATEAERDTAKLDSRIENPRTPRQRTRAKATQFK